MRFPARLNTPDGLKHLLLELKTVMASDEYADMRALSVQKTSEVAVLKWARDEARKALAQRLTRVS